MTDYELYSRVANDYVVRGVKALQQSKKWAKLSKVPLVGMSALRKANALADDAADYLELSAIATIKALTVKED